MKISVVVVIYNLEIEKSKTIQSLLRIMKDNEHIKNTLSLLIYDNSPKKQNVENNGDMEYIHDSRNKGLATAYNYALEQANKLHSEWLLLFDQDTELTSNYFNKLIENVVIEEDVVALVPKIKSNNQLISPVFSNTLRPLVNKQPALGLSEEPLMAINSASALRVSFLNKIKGFNMDFPLDYLDHWLFYKIYQSGKKVYIIDALLEHELSVMDYNTISLNRYKSILDSETKFYKEYKHELYPQYKKQLLLRFVKQLLFVNNKRIAFNTLRKIIFELRKGL